ncbi:MAG: protein kinase, partial [Thermoanaerobaculia bacterium]|nr:protein kinase [Thermoanaerobaculia bacterium]
MIGQTISHYRILERIGAGGMGVVYKAEDLELGRPVAIKLLPPELAEDEAAKERFQHEARTASALDHANICTIYEAGETDDGRLFLAMAYYRGRTLKQRIAAGPIPLGEAIDILAQVARGLERAHAAGVFHRDIKPANVIITEHGEAKILDFGLAKLAEGAQRTRSGTTVGTPAYMSPEQVQGDDVDGRTDLWSLGVVAYEMLAGRPPFRGANESAIIYSILHEEPDSLAEQRPDVPPPLREVVTRALVKDPEERIESARAFLRRLRPLLGDTPTEAIEVSPSEHPTRTAPHRAEPAVKRRIPWAVTLVAAVAVAAVLLLVWRRQEESPPAAVPPATPAAEAADVVTVFPFTFRGNPDYAYLGDGLVDLLSTKLDGAGDIRASDPHAVLSRVERDAARSGGLEAFERIAESFSATYFVTGEILEAGGRLHISASLYQPGARRPATTHTVEGPAEDVFQLVDELAAELLAEQIQAPSVRVFSTAAMTTESLPALRSYLKAESELRRGEFTKALESYQKTVALDPEFALAWYRLSVAAEWSTQNMLVGPAVAKALEHADRLSAHDRDLLEARLANRAGDPERAEQIYRSILGRHPEDVEAWIQMGEILSHYGFMTGRSLTASREAFERVIHLEPSFVGGWWHLARVAAVENRPEEVDRIVRRILEMNPEGERALELEVLRAVVLEDEAELASLIEELRRVEDHVVLTAAWSLEMTQVDPAAAIRVAEVLTEPRRSDEARAIGHEVLAWLELCRGRLRAAFEHLDAAGEISIARRLESETLVRLRPWVPTDEAELRGLRARLEAWDASAVPPSTNPSNFFSQHNGLHPLLRTYLLELVEARLTAETGAVGAPQAERQRTATLLRDAARDLDADLAGKLAGFLPHSVELYRAYLAGD